MTDVRKENQHFLVKVRQEKRTVPCTNFKKGSCQRESSCNCWHVPDSTKFKAPGGGRFGDKCAYKHKAKLRMKRKNQYLLLNTFHRMMNDRCKYGKFSRMTGETSSSCEQVRSERENWDLHLESSRLDLRISEILTRKRSIEWTPSMEEKQGEQPVFFFLHKNVYKHQGSVFWEFDRHKFFKPGPASNVCALGSFTSYGE